MEIKKILVSQPRPTPGRNPYSDIEERFGVEIDFRTLIHIEVLSAKEFRAQHINILDYTAVLFNSRVAIDQFFALCEDLRARGKVVGFTNGCFDLLHPGHLQSFERARALCDVLIVGLNTDASIRRLKGPDRPVNNEQSRAALLAALKTVDYVVLFDDDTALPLMEKLRPDVIAEEGYPIDKWPEGQLVESYGGRAVELPRLEGFSSTAIIDKLQH